MVGSFTCQPCAPGSFSFKEGSQICESCPKGTYSGFGDSQCTPCPAGTYSEFLGGATFCIPCQPGYL